jgi:gluconolactonase
MDARVYLCYFPSVKNPTGRHAMKKLFAVVSMMLFAGLGLARAQAPAGSSLVKLDAALDRIVSADAKVEKVAGGFTFVEGPVWVRKGPSAYLLFSDLPANAINRWTPDGKVSVYLKPSGFTGPDPSGLGAEFDSGHGKYYLFGSNGITLDPQGRVVFCAHGDHAIVRLEPDGKRTILADRYEGKRLNSPNDLVYKKDGALYFTDPSAGFRQGDNDPRKELPFQGVFLLKDGKLRLLVRDLIRPNGIAFSPDEKYLYVDDTVKKLIMRYEVQPDDGVANGQVFMDMTADKAPGVPDGMKVDTRGNLYGTGPGGVWVISPEGKHLGTILTPEVASNLAFGDADGMSLYVTARSSLYRIRLKVPGIMLPKFSASR